MTQKELGQQIRNNKESLALRVTDLYEKAHPNYTARFGEKGHYKSIQDAEYHFLYLSEALETEEPVLFANYLRWVADLFDSLSLPRAMLVQTLVIMKETLTKAYGPEHAGPALAMLDKSQEEVSSHEGPAGASYIDGSGPLDSLARQYLEALLAADRKQASDAIAEALKNGTSIKDIYLHVFQRSQQEIGRLWQINKISVAQEHYCSAATQMIMAQLYPFIFTGEPKERRIIVACVSGELHEIGARMVADLFEMDGWDSYFVGANTPLKDLIETIGTKHADIVALSVTMTFHLSELTSYIREIRNTYGAVKIMVGGYPFTISPTLWQKVGADAWAPDAVQAVAVAEGLIA